jgi:large subunit ribosomal protein L18
MLTNYERRKFRVRNKIAASNKSNRPRISVARSNKNLQVQLIAVDGNVICAFSSLKLDQNKKASGIEKAKEVGREFAKICLGKGVKEVVFDKGAYVYNGRVKALAESCREAGLQF